VIRRLGIIVAWLLAGHGVTFGLFWTLLQVPESSTPMLALSVLLALLSVGAAAVTASGAAGAWIQEMSPMQGLRLGVRRASAALVAAALFGLVWWLTGYAFDWHASVSGQVDAAIMARTGSPRTAWLHAGVRWLIVFVRWAVGLSLAVSLLGALVGGGRPALGRTDWIRRALRPRRLLAVLFWLALLDVLPWSQLYWRPAQLSLGVEPWFVAVKLTLIAVTMTIGWALILREGVRG
jgi:hypothetical protein